MMFGKSMNFGGWGKKEVSGGNQERLQVGEDRDMAADGITRLYVLIYCLNSEFLLHFESPFRMV